MEKCDLFSVGIKLIYTNECQIESSNLNPKHRITRS
jgi:hypothetical protein